MKAFFHLLINSFVVLCVSYLLSTVYVESVEVALVVAFVMGLISVTVKPVLLILTLPINILTLGLFTFVINALMIELADYIVPGFIVDGFLSALLFGLILSISNVVFRD